MQEQGKRRVRKNGDGWEKSHKKMTLREKKLGRGNEKNYGV